MTTPNPLTALTDELIAAWIAWDARAALISSAAQARIDAGERPPRLAAHTLEPETRRLSAAERALNMPLGYTARIAALRWRRNTAGEWVEAMKVGDAVQAVINELVPARLRVVAGDQQEPQEGMSMKEAS